VPATCPPPSSRTSGVAERTEQHKELIAWSCCAAVLIISTIVHEPWRDELQAWAIARSADTPLDLIDGLRWERHPPLWHSILWVMAQFTRDVIGLKVVGLAAGLTTMWLLIRYAPGPLWVRVALSLGYYPLYELGTVNRSWSIIGLLVLIALIESDRPTPRRWIIALAIFGLPMTELHAAPIAAALAVVVLLPLLTSRRGRYGMVAAGIVAGIALVVVLPAPDGNDWNRVHLLPDGTFLIRLQTIVAGMQRAVLPIPDLLEPGFNRFAIEQIPILAGLIGLGALVGVATALRHHRRALTFWLISAGGLAYLVAAFGLPMQPRQASLLFWSMVAVVWLVRQDAVGAEWAIRWRTPVGIVAAVVIAVGSAAGIWAWARDISQPFSNARSLAAWVGERVEEQVEERKVVVLCAQGVPQCSSVAILLDTTLHRSASDPGTEYLLYDRGWRRHSRAQSTLIEAQLLADRLDVDVVVVEPRSSSQPTPCRDPWLSTQHPITNEDYSACMLKDLVDEDSSTAPIAP